MPDVVPCPPDPWTAEVTSEEGARLAQLEWEVEPDVRAAGAYGATVPDEFAGARYWHSDPVSVMVTFTGHLEEHRAALEPLLVHPDRLIVCTGPVTAAEADLIQGALNAYLEAGEITSHGISSDGPIVEVSMLANRQDVAEELHAIYGGKVRLLVGAFQYLPPDPLPPMRCPATADAIETPAGVTLALDPVSIAIGSAVRPTVALIATNDSGGVVELGDVRTVDVVDAEGRAVTVFVGFQRLDYRPNPVGPAGPLTLDLDIPLSSCDLEDGYALAPGENTMVATTQVGTATAPLTVTP